MLDRPRSSNAIALQTGRAICSAIDKAETDTSVRAIVITGAGDRVFSAGADLKELPETRGHPEMAQEHDEQFDQTMARISACRKPTIARINAHVIGGAFTLIMACDLRLAASSATFRIPVAKLGLMYSAAETTALTSIIGPSRTKWLMMTGRPISATTAHEWGLVEQVFDDQEFDTGVAQVVADVCKGAPLSHRVTKALVDTTTRNGTIDRDSAKSAYQTIYTSNDIAEGLAAYQEKRDPDFKGN